MNEPLAIPSYRFGRYTLSPLTEADRPRLEAWIAADPFHDGRVSADFFLHTVPGEEGWCLLDEYDEPIFYLKTATAVRLHIQFGPSRSPAERERNREALTEGVEWIEGVLSARSFREMIFDSFNPLLRRMATKRLGFTASQEELRRPVPIYEATEGPESAWRGTQEPARTGQV